MHLVFKNYTLLANPCEKYSSCVLIVLGDIPIHIPYTHVHTKIQC